MLVSSRIQTCPAISLSHRAAERSPKGVSHSGSLGDLGSEADAHARLSSWQVDVADIEAHELSQAEAGAEGEGDEESFAGAILEGLEER